MEVNQDLNEQEREFKAALLSEDDVGMVIRTHILIEWAVGRFIEEALHDASHVLGSEIDYFQKVNLAISCGLNQDLKGALLYIGTMRNKFAHRLGQSIGKESMNNWYQAFSPNLKKSMHETLSGSDVSWVKRKVSWAQVDPQNKFIAMATCAFYETKIEVLRVEHERKVKRLSVLAVANKECDGA